MKILKTIGKIDNKGCLRLDIETDLPTGEVDLEISISPKNVVKNYDFSDIAGKLSISKDSLELQRELRNEWE